ncbi:hypothetical protein PspLS_00036 [Pyricularia sp. CBS 133598]|nr:hypothetical protein PspLS_00036 [Pyricularia sp. CBS 133598]
MKFTTIFMLAASITLGTAAVVPSKQISAELTARDTQLHHVANSLDKRANDDGKDDGKDKPAKPKPDPKPAKPKPDPKPAKPKPDPKPAKPKPDPKPAKPKPDPKPAPKPAPKAPTACKFGDTPGVCQNKNCIVGGNDTGLNSTCVIAQL